MTAPEIANPDGARERPRWRVLVADHLPEAGWEILRAEPGVEAIGPIEDREALVAALPEADALITRSATRVDRALLEAAPRLRVLGRAGPDLSGIDLDACTERGILVQSVPRANLRAVAELVFGLLLSAARQIPQAHAAMLRGEYPRHDMLGVQLHGKQLGLLGFGRLGRAVANRARAFGMRVLVCDPFVELASAREEGVEVLGLEEMLARCDVLCLCTALTERTRGLIDAEALARLQPGGILVNCARPELLDEAALLAALDEGRLAWAALDRLQEEPPSANPPLVSHPRVIALPHLGQNTRESQAATGRAIARDVLDALAGRDVRSTVNLPFEPDAPYPDAAPYLRLAEKLGRLQGQLAEAPVERLEIEALGEVPSRQVRAIAACLLAGVLETQERPSDVDPTRDADLTYDTDPTHDADPPRINWISAPPLAWERGIQVAQARDLVQLGDYPNLIACRLSWPGGSRTLAGALFANDETRLVQYEDFRIDAHPEGEVLIIESEDQPGVIGQVGTLLGQAGINIASWRYGRQRVGGRALSFINLDQALALDLLERLRQSPEIHRARQLRL